MNNKKDDSQEFRGEQFDDFQKLFDSVNNVDTSSSKNTQSEEIVPVEELQGESDYVDDGGDILAGLSGGDFQEVEEVEEVIEIPLPTKANFNEIQDPVEWGLLQSRNIFANQEYSEPEPVEPALGNAQEEIQDTPSSKVDNDDETVKVIEEDEVEGKRGKKSKKGKKSKEKLADKKEKRPKGTKTKKSTDSNDTPIKDGFPKKYYYPTDVEVDVSDGKEYVYFSVEKTLRHYNALWLTKIISISTFERITYDNDFFDGLAQKMHDNTVELNNMTAQEQQAYESKKKTIKLSSIGGVLAVFMLIVFLLVIPSHNYDSGIVAINDKNYEDAYDKLSSLGTKDNSHVYARYAQGHVYMNLGKAELANINEPGITEEQKDACIQQAIDYYDESKQAFVDLTDYTHILSSNIATATNEGIDEHVKNLSIEADYNKAIMLYQIKEYTLSSEIFESIYEYKEATDYYYKCKYALADESYSEGNAFEAISNFYTIGSVNFEDASERLQELAQDIYDEAYVYYNKKDYENAIENFAFLAQYNFKDASDMIYKCRYQYALDFYKAGDYKKALSNLNNIEQYRDALSIKKDCLYKLGVIAYNTNPVDSIYYFSQLSKFKNADSILASPNLTLYGEWRIVELNDAAVQEMEFSFNGDGNIITNNPNLLGVQISTSATQYKYIWSNNKYVSADGDYSISIKIVDFDNVYMTCDNGTTQYTYRCVRTLGYLEMTNQSLSEGQQELSVSERLELIISQYIKDKMDGIFGGNKIENTTEVPDGATESQTEDSVDAESDGTTSDESETTSDDTPESE